MSQFSVCPVHLTVEVDSMSPSLSIRPGLEVEGLSGSIARFLQVSKKGIRFLEPIFGKGHSEDGQGEENDEKELDLHGFVFRIKLRFYF